MSQLSVTPVEKYINNWGVIFSADMFFKKSKKENIQWQFTYFCIDNVVEIEFSVSC